MKLSFELLVAARVTCERIGQRSARSPALLGDACACDPDGGGVPRAASWSNTCCAITCRRRAVEPAWTAAADSWHITVLTLFVGSSIERSAVTIFTMISTFAVF